LTNYLLLDTPLDPDPEIATHQVYAALASGRSYFINRLDGACPNLIFHAEQGATSSLPGATLSLQDGPVRLFVDTVLDAEVQVIHNGQVLTKSIRQLRQTINAPGIYRLEAYRNGRPWLYSNPVYVTK
jgi:hypothetical protein